MVRGAAIVALAFACGAAAAPAPPPAAPPGAPPAAPPAPQAAPLQPRLEASAAEGQVRATLKVAEAAAEVGRPILVELRIDRPAGTSVRVASAAVGSQWGSFEVRGEGTPGDAAAPEDPTRVLRSWRLISWESGVVELPALSITVRPDQGPERTLSVGPLAIPVASLLPADADPRSALRPVKDAVEVPVDFDWRPWAVGAGAVAACLVIAALLWRRLRRPRVVPEPLPHERARAALAALRGEDLPGRGRVHEFYVRISDIVRRYVEDRFSIRAPEQTTKEFLAAARSHPSIQEHHQRLLAGFLRAADMVKFAAARPGPDECQRTFDAANTLVDETIIQPASGTEGAR